MSGCFDRRNNENLNQFKCDPAGNLGLKSCCMRGDSCASNGLCVSDDPKALTPYFISGCTVDDWDDPTCPTQCYNSTGNGIKPCGDGKFCCFGRSDCNCNDEKSLFEMDPIRIVASIPSDASRAPTSTSIQPTVTSTSESISDTSKSSSTILTTRESTFSQNPEPNSATTSSITSISSTGPVETTSTLSPDDGSSSSSSSNILPIGLGIGLGVGIPLLVVITILVWLLMKKAQKTQTPEPPPLLGELATHDAQKVESVAYDSHYATTKSSGQAIELDSQPRAELT